MIYFSKRFVSRKSYDFLSKELQIAIQSRDSAIRQMTDSEKIRLDEGALERQGRGFTFAPGQLLGITPKPDDVTEQYKLKKDK